MDAKAEAEKRYAFDTDWRGPAVTDDKVLALELALESEHAEHEEALTALAVTEAAAGVAQERADRLARELEQAKTRLSLVTAQRDRLRDALVQITGQPDVVDLVQRYGLSDVKRTRPDGGEGDG